MRNGRRGHLAATALGVAASAGLAAMSAQGDVTGILVTADRLSDEATAERVSAAIRQDPFIFGDHVTVTAKNGVVRLRGTICDLSDLFQILRMARKIAGKGKVANELEFVPLDADHD